MRRKMRRFTPPGQPSNVASNTFDKCRKCHKLERRYQRSVDEIFSVLDRRFMRMEQKLCELHELQDMRDKAARAVG